MLLDILIPLFGFLVFVFRVYKLIPLLLDWGAALGTGWGIGWATGWATGWGIGWGTGWEVGAALVSKLLISSSFSHKGPIFILSDALFLRICFTKLSKFGLELRSVFKFSWRKSCKLLSFLLQAFL